MLDSSEDAYGLLFQVGRLLSGNWEQAFGSL